MKRRLLGMLAVVLMLAPASYFSRPDGNIHVSFLSVGQGSAVLIQNGDVEILVDGGPSPQAVANELGRRLPYWDRTIELVVLTHPHEDHLAGLVEVCKRYRVSAVLQPLFEDGPYSSALAAEWHNVPLETRTRVITAGVDQQISLGNIMITVLNSPAPVVPGKTLDQDSGALVLNVAAGGFNFLLTSDIDRKAELDLLYDRRVPDCDVLQVAHHGSGLSTSLEFLRVARPEAAVIPVGENSFGHPGGEVLERLEGVRLYRTDEDGTVEFIIGGGKLRVKTGR